MISVVLSTVLRNYGFSELRVLRIIITVHCMVQD